MKNNIYIALTLMVFLPLSMFTQTKCDTLGAILDGIINQDASFYSDGQSYKYFLGEDESTEIVTTFYEGSTYRIATSAGLEDNYMVFDVLDEERNILFTNASYANAPYWDFNVENTIECTIEARLDPNKKLNGCAQLIIAFKKAN
tara:strand:- start:2249 stop:2683 length:435 start_codon:yes stop_codon:yes gene_type:complete